jgi:5-methyltetrahydrofolate--homocysteine methyltransferase
VPDKLAPILDRLACGEILVADGAMGSMLLERGLDPGQPPEKFNLSHPELLEGISRLYLQAGADIVQTNTFGASPLRLARHRLDGDAARINQQAVRAARNAAGDRAYISGTCGPSGRLLKPYGDTEPDDIYAGFLIQIEILIAEGVDVICVETMTDPSEAALAVKAARAVSSGIPIMATMTFDDTPRGFFTCMGTTVEHAVKTLTEVGAQIIGSNCGNGIDNMVRIAAEFHAATDLPILIQSNAGLPEIRDGVARYTETPEFMAAQVPALIEAGASIIGGCCGTTPDHIAAIRKQVDALCR